MDKVVQKQRKGIVRQFITWFTKNHEAVANYLTLFALIGGAAGFFWQYYTNNVAERKQEIKTEQARMFTFLARYYEPPTADARRSVERLTYDNKFLNMLKNPDNKYTIVKYLIDIGIEDDLMKLVDYFSILSRHA